MVSNGYQSEVKNTLEGINSTLDKAEIRINDLENKVAKLIERIVFGPIWCPHVATECLECGQPD